MIMSPDIEKDEVGDETPTDSSQVALEPKSNTPDAVSGFEHVEISVVPTIKAVGNMNGGAQSQLSNTGEVVEDENGVQVDTGEFQVGVETEAVSLEDCEDLSQMMWNLPSMLMGDHLERTPDQTAPFARQLHKYCCKKGIDPNEYMFDEFGLIVSAGVIAMGLKRDHDAHKKNLKPEHMLPASINNPAISAGTSEKEDIEKKEAKKPETSAVMVIDDGDYEL